MENKQASIGIAIGKNYDSEFCGSIPLHLVNLIQQHGVLLTLSTQDLRIVQSSENAPQFLSLTIEELLGQPIASFLPATQVTEILAKIQHPSLQEKIPFSLTLTVKDQETQFTALAHLKDSYILLELE